MIIGHGPTQTHTNLGKELVCVSPCVSVANFKTDINHSALRMRRFTSNLSNDSLITSLALSVFCM